MYVKSAPSLISFISTAILAASLGWSGAAAHAQDSSAPAPAGNPAPAARASDSQFDIGVSGYEAFNKTTTANGVVQTPANAPGGMIEFRYIEKPLVGFELTYGYNKGNQTIAPAATGCGYSCSNPAQAMTASTSLVGLDWILSKKIGNLRPFFAGGLGFFIDEPTAPRIATSSTTTVPGYGVNDTVRLAWLYGGGVDFSVTQHFGVRAQYRLLTYRTPNLSVLFPAQGVYTTTSEPAGGIFYRF